MAEVLERARWISADRPTNLNGPQKPGFEPVDVEALKAAPMAHFVSVAGRHAARVAITDGTTTLTYAQTLQAAYNLAWKIDAVAPPDMPVACLIQASALFPVALLATGMTGRVLVAVDSAHPPSRQAAILEEAGAGLLLAAEDVEIDDSLIPEGLPRLIGAIDLADGPAFPIRERALDSIAGLGFTSGSTGRPKGIAHAVGPAMTGMANFINACQIGPGDKIISVASPAVGGSRDTFNALLTGATVRVCDIKTVGIAEALRIMEEEEITILSFIPLAVRTILAMPGAERAFRSLRVLDLYSDRTLVSDIELIREKLPDCHIRVCLASTEVGMMFEWWVPKDMAFDGEAIPVGYLSPGKEILLLDEDGEPVGEGEEGEIVVRSRSMALGAWQGGKLVPGRFQTDPEDPSYRIYNVGDLVRIRPDGLAEFIGRRDRQIKIRGLKANPTDVEATIRHLGVFADVAVVPRPFGDEHVLIAYVVAADPADPMPSAAVREAMAEELTPHTVPLEVHYLDAIPRLPNYKADMVALQAIDAQKAEAAPAASTSMKDAPPPVVTADPELEAKVLRAVGKAWTAVLNRRSFEADQAWDDAGGDSLKSLQLIFHIEAALDRTIPLEVMSMEARPSWLARAIVADIQGQAADAESHERPRMFLFPGIGGDEPRLARFRNALSRWILFDTIDYPDVERKVRDISDFSVIVDEAVAHVQAAQPMGPVFLSGHSFGGLVAFETAQRLQKAGRRIGFLGLLDTPAFSPEAALFRLPLWKQEAIFFHQSKSVSGTGYAMAESAVRLAVQAGQARLVRRLILGVRKALGPHRAVYLRKVMLENLRKQALKAYRPERHDGTLHLFRANQQAMPGLPADLGWSTLAREVEVVEVAGGHTTLFDAGQLEDNASKYLAVLARSVSKAAAA